MKDLVELEVKRFELEQQRGAELCKSAFFPDSLKDDIASAIIIYDLANRMNVSVMEVAQSIYIIYNKPSFATSFMVARLNQSKLIKGVLKTTLSEDKKECYCEAVDRESGETLKGFTVTMDMARAEGWIDKKGSKWKTMPELMIRKRAQSFFINEFYPEVKFGMQSKEDVEDMVDTELDTSPVEAPPVNALQLEADIKETLSQDATIEKVTTQDLLSIYKNSKNQAAISAIIAENPDWKNYDHDSLSILHKKFLKVESKNG